jgi:N-acetylmuramoyl-L-alanine amidase
MLRAVYEENRRIAEDDARTREVRRRRYIGGVGMLVVAMGAVVIFVGESSSLRAPDRSDMASPTAIFGADLPVVDTSDAEDDWVPEEEYRALLAQDTPLAALFSLRVRTIVLDPGHGGVDPGAVGPSGALEKDITLDVALRLARRLEDHGYRVLMTRKDDRTISLRERVEFANSRPTDLFVSIHLNELPIDSVNMVETYFFGANTESRSLRVAEKENSGADYTVADFNGMIRRVSTTMKLQESRQLARAIQRSVFTNKRQLDLEVANWGVKSGPFVVLLGSEAPSALAEIGVLSHPEDERRLQSAAHREQLATFMEEGILTYLISRTRDGSGSETAQ